MAVADLGVPGVRPCPGSLAPPDSWVSLRIISPVSRLGLGISFSTVIRQPGPSDVAPYKSRGVAVKRNSKFLPPMWLAKLTLRADSLLALTQEWPSPLKVFPGQTPGAWSRPGGSGNRLGSRG